MDATTHPRSRRFHVTPGRFVLALLAVEVLLWLSERFGWLPWHKGYAVLTAVASVGVAMLLVFVWFGSALAKLNWRQREHEIATPLHEPVNYESQP